MIKSLLQKNKPAPKGTGLYTRGSTLVAAKTRPLGFDYNVIDGRC